MTVHPLSPHLADGAAPESAAHKPASRRRADDRADRAPEPLIRVRRHPKDWPRAAYFLSDISDLHDDRAADYRTGDAPSFLYGHVWCDAMDEGVRLHPCPEGSGAHLIKICVAKSDNEQIFGQLIERCAPPDLTIGSADRVEIAP